MMLKRALIAVLVLVVVVFLYIGYSGYDAGRGSVSAGSGSGRTRAAEGPISVTPTEPATVPAPAGGGSLPAAPATGVDLTAADGRPSSSGLAAPATDTIRPDPPNGMAFGGSGHFQLYRQGNLTWRLNTDTGESCVVFATEEEWRKPQVYRSGCHTKDGQVAAYRSASSAQ